MDNRLRRLGVWCAVVALLACFAVPAGAVPDLQVYVDGATYDTGTDTWVVESPSFDLQVIGANDTIIGVQLVAALVPPETLPSSGSITLTPQDFGPPSGWTYGTPLLSDGSSLPPHGIYPTNYITLPIGDFTPTETVYDMVGGGSAQGQIKIIHVDITGFDKVHFDAYNHIIGEQHVKYVNNPGSHDSEGGDGYVPEPGTLALLSLGLMGTVAAIRRKRQ